MRIDRFLAAIRIIDMVNSSKTTLYFDGQCPLCSREIAKLKKSVLEPISFVDIHEADLSKTDKTLFLKKLHLFRDGEVEVGFKANLSLWIATRYGWLFAVFKVPLVFELCDAIYDFWAKHRFKSRYPELD